VRKDGRIFNIIVPVIKSKKIRLLEYVVCMGEKRSLYRIMVGKPEKKGNMREPDLDGLILIIIRWILRK